MPENILMVIAEKDGAPIAASLNLVNKTTLFGRYWGAIEFVSGLHFETCYYQTIEYCIDNGLTLFEGGAQGEHKLARGFVPVQCTSAHLIKDPRFASAVEDFLRRESNGIERYVDELNEHQPFKSTPVE
jgi:predicted N-acyltransferase